MSESEGLQLERRTRVPVLALTFRDLCPSGGAARRAYLEQTPLPSPTQDRRPVSHLPGHWPPDGTFWAPVQSPLSVSQAVSSCQIQRGRGTGDADWRRQMAAGRQPPRRGRAPRLNGPSTQRWWRPRKSCPGLRLRQCGCRGKRRSWGPCYPAPGRCSGSIK